MQSKEERKGTLFDPKDAFVFNNFISTSGLHDLQLCGRRFPKMWLPYLGDQTCSGAADFVLKEKLKVLKNDLRKWSKLESAKTFKRNGELCKAMLDWDLKAEQGEISEEDCIMKEGWLFELLQLEYKEKLDLSQKSRSKWAIEGDENTKYFHGIVNHRWWRNKIKEIKEAVWSCNGSKALGPDGLNFNFIKQFWPILGDSMVAALQKFERTGNISKGCNVSFIALIPKKFDPLEISDYRPISLLGCSYKILAKVDFEKAFDSVNWNFLFHIMDQMGFGLKWINWIRGCLKSASTSILINGSPSKEFRMERGLWQGDPLSPFLFLLAGEVLQQMLVNACNSGLFKGLQLESSNRNISLLQFADDALVFGKWSKKNIFALSNILGCFHEVSGLRINLSKCNLYGIGVSDVEVKEMADRLGCKASAFPFNYLRNEALLAKWIWRFLSSKEAIWKEVIKEFYGTDGGLFSPRHLDDKSTWAAIVNCCKGVEFAGQNFIASFSKIISTDSRSSFWEELALGSGARLKLKDLFPRIYALEKDKTASFKDRWKFINGTWSGTWDWIRPLRGRALDDLQALENRLSSLHVNSSRSDFWNWDWHNKGTFSVKHLVKLLQHDPGGESGEKIIWNPLIPLKVNIFLWRLFKEAISTRFNLSKRGVHLNSLACIFCEDEVETTDHCLFSCTSSSNLWRKIWAWWGLNLPRLSSVSDFHNFVQQSGTSSSFGSVIVAVCAVALWQLWRRRNDILHADEATIARQRYMDLFPSVQSLSKLWIGNRANNLNLNFDNWFSSPRGG
ncbi:hypothetical protein OSB04_000414 [Centaurea solstitialis]|uniref:Reverse transcriptase domain-containing protein n=1 Tax=Centaurea solstitialis TaxID=347529 RepID=A0AA38TP10_9ASTR|nr:hypothetical protein OSB04_000414 [Centaurea solstitialis]